MLRNTAFLICSLGLIFSANAETKKISREPAARVKKTKSITCSNAAGDGGYTVTIFNSKRATVLENNIAGAVHLAELTCGLLPERSTAPDMIHSFISCSGKVQTGESKDKDVSVVLSHGGFAGLTEADLDIDKANVAEDMICR